MAFITVTNDKGDVFELPYPNSGLSFTIATFVNSARNSKGVLVGQVVGRNNLKIDNLKWFRLTAEQWRDVLDAFSGFYATVTFPDPQVGTWVTQKMYPSDRKAVVCDVGDDDLPIVYKDCTVNIIDVGE